MIPYILKTQKGALAPFCVWTEHFKRKRCRNKFPIYNKIFLVIPKISQGRFIYFQKINISGVKKFMSRSNSVLSKKLQKLGLNINFMEYSSPVHNCKRFK
ncbi:hypothetical protein CH367_08990 [Leptospira barantonii]|uniref:Uncharacterized protein n=1 Tax=Leptospira barantonii TaxID=2023184 RepID=A0ABX4NKY1_9LEPT|nr:hypothetical protein CH367_08990 [Leptospira barantonii]